MTCQYERGAHQCRNLYTQVQYIPLPNGDLIRCYLCQPHADALDAIKWAQKRRDNV